MRADDYARLEADLREMCLSPFLGSRSLKNMIRLDQIEGWKAGDRHLEFVASLERRAKIMKAEVVAEIHAKFRKEFRGHYYVFLVKRPRDTDPWPAIFSDPERAESYEDRYGPVVEVIL